jgi:hypothetical protein
MLCPECGHDMDVPVYCGQCCWPECPCNEDDEDEGEGEG